MYRSVLATAIAALVSLAPVLVTPAAAANWTGFYVGISAGGGWGGGDVRYVLPPVAAGPFSYDTSGGVYGGHVGYQWQTGNWVLGAEASLRYSNVNGTGGCNVGNNDTCEFELDHLTVVNGRVGWAMGDTLFFGTVGYANASIDMTRHVFPPAINLNPSFGTFDHTGYELGVGVECAITPNIILGGEYQYVDLGDDTTRAVRNDGAFATFKNSPSGLSIFQARLSYKFTL